MTLLLLALAVAVLFAVIIGVAAGTMARLDGARPMACVQRGAVAFLATCTLCVAMLSLVVAAI
ncbi:hypothetical protein [Embleya sp. NPDC050493]|uniref:hypothetical protein n=1 Tax=Embleya sp. NPDC050493 TaxID=3363989 RepID=UPI0037A08231